MFYQAGGGAKVNGGPAQEAAKNKNRQLQETWVVFGRPEYLKATLAGDFYFFSPKFFKFRQANRKDAVFVAGLGAVGVNVHRQDDGA